MSTSGSYLAFIHDLRREAATIEVGGQDVALQATINNHDTQDSTAELRDRPIVAHDPRLIVGLGPFRP